MKRLAEIFLFIIFISLNTATLAHGADEPVIRAYVDKKIAYIGDRIKYSVEVAHKKEAEIFLPSFKNGLIGDFEIKDYARLAKRGFLGGRLTAHIYYITSYEVGKHVIPEIEIRFRQKSGGDWKTLKTKPITISIESVLPKGKLPDDIRDIKGPIRFREIGRMVLFIVIFLLCVLAVALYLKKRSRAPARLAHETAMEELEASRQEFSKGGNVERYYVGVSDCIRRYIERAFKIKAPEMTTEEFLDSLKESTALSMEQKSLLRDFLSACDLVKFAKYSPARGEMESAYLAAKKFIEDTRPVPSAEEAKKRK